VEWIAIAVIFITSFFDAVRDASRNNPGWRRPEGRLPWPMIDKWHLVKRLAFYTPLVFILVAHVNYIFIIPVIVISYFLWHKGNRF
tara:strand:+ start:2369 stop:2626 length:258 start_codon:yes stop_codon:yes gene_type:complete